MGTNKLLFSTNNDFSGEYVILNPPKLKTYWFGFDTRRRFNFSPINGIERFIDYLYRKNNSDLIKRLFLNPTFAYVYQLYNTDKVSFLELQPGGGAQYARSAGVFATFIKLNLFDHTVTFKLPSGVEKIVSIYASVMIGPVAFKSKRLLRNTKSGF